MLKKRFTEIAAVVAMTMSAGAAQAVELVDNGGFETGDFTGWVQESPQGNDTKAVTNVNPASGIYSANLNCSAGVP